jgi:hypothetical protein
MSLRCSRWSFRLRYAWGTRDRRLNPPRLVRGDGERFRCPPDAACRRRFVGRCSERSARLWARRLLMTSPMKKEATRTRTPPPANSALFRMDVCSGGL